MLGIPTVKDRMVQQAISQWLGQFYEPDISKNSYGFRPHRGGTPSGTSSANLSQRGEGLYSRSSKIAATVDNFMKTLQEDVF
jgi:hypothetical protein